jgi:hypothetical protein
MPVRKNVDLSYCVDKNLNDVTEKDFLADENRWHHGYARRSQVVLDLKSSHPQVAFHPDDKEKTAFSTGQGMW